MKHYRHRTSWFSRFANRTAHWVGHPVTFFIAIAVVIAWAFTGPFFGFSDTWQLVINTATTIITFLMVFLIQNTQNRDGQAMQLKLDEIIRAVEGAHNALLDIEQLSDQELDEARRRYSELAERARDEMRHGRTDTGSPEVAIGSEGLPARRPSRGHKRQRPPAR
jgi:low affinity Fe/Cu permease